MSRKFDLRLQYSAPPLQKGHYSGPPLQKGH